MTVKQRGTVGNCGNKMFQICIELRWTDNLDFNFLIVAFCLHISLQDPEAQVEARGLAGRQAMGESRQVL